LRSKSGLWMVFKIIVEMKSASIGPKIRSFWQITFGDRSCLFIINLDTFIKKEKRIAFGILMYFFFDEFR